MEENEKESNVLGEYEQLDRPNANLFPMMAIARLVINDITTDFDGSFGFDWMKYNGNKYTEVQNISVNDLEKYVDFQGGIATFKAPNDNTEKENVAEK